MDIKRSSNFYLYLYFEVVLRRKGGFLTVLTPLKTSFPPFCYKGWHRKLTWPPLLLLTTTHGGWMVCLRVIIVVLLKSFSHDIGT